MLKDENRQMQVHSKETRMEQKETTPLLGESLNDKSGLGVKSNMFCK